MSSVNDTDFPLVGPAKDSFWQMISKTASSETFTKNEKMFSRVENVRIHEENFGGMNSVENFFYRVAPSLRSLAVSSLSEEFPAEQGRFIALLNPQTLRHLFLLNAPVSFTTQLAAREWPQLQILIVDHFQLDDVSSPELNLMCACSNL